MRLEKFRIVNCFGFDDSNYFRVAADQNLTYFLGKNSSGKTSVLNAISAMEPNFAPQSYPRFQNYQEARGNPEPVLRALFQAQDQSSLPSISSRAPVERTMQYFSDYGAVLGSSEEGLQVTHTTRQREQRHQALSNLIEAVSRHYKELAEQIERSLQVFVEKTGNGTYRFLGDVENYEQYQARRDEILQKWNACKGSGNTVNINDNPRQINLSFDTIEGSFFDQLPEILNFHERLSVKVDLPRILTPNRIQQPENTLTRALIERLGESSLLDLLRVNVTEEIEELEQELNSKLADLAEEINAVASAGGNDELVGLQIRKGSPGEALMLVRTDQGEQHYEHISDNAKFLIAYHILKEYRFRRNTSYAVLLFDEPNQGFHPSAEDKLLQFLETLSEQENQVVITTHSQHMIDLNMLGGVRIMDRDREGLKVHDNWWGASGPSRNTLVLQPIAEAIGLRYADQLIDYNSTVVVEGYTDLLYIRKFAQLLGLTSPNMAPVTGQQKSVTLISFLISQGVPFKVAIDESRKKAQLQSGLNVEDSSFFIVEECIGGSQSQQVGVEDLFARDDFRQMLAQSGHTINAQELQNISNSGYAKNNRLKRVLAHSIYEDTSISANDFTSTTTENFKSLLEFCNNDNWSCP